MDAFKDHYNLSEDDLNQEISDSHLDQIALKHCAELPTVQGCPGQSRDLTDFQSLSRDPGIVQGFHASMG